MSAQAISRPPVVKGLPVIGNLIPVMRDTLGFIRQQYQRVGPVFQIRVLNHHLMVLAGVEAVELMASNDGSLSNWDIWEGVSTEFGGQKNLGMLDGEPHSRYRKIMRQGFSRNTITDNIPRMVEMTQQSLAGLKAGDSFAVMPFTRRLVSQQIGVLTIGRDPGEYLDDFVELANCGTSADDKSVARKTPKIASLRQSTAAGRRNGTRNLGRTPRQRDSLPRRHIRR
jgi:cytochrome P450